MITSFRGVYRFLSNFYPAPVLLDYHVYPTVEHAYQAAKSLDPDYRVLVQYADTPGDAKRMGRRAVLRSDWDMVKLEVMERLVREKFRWPEFSKRLKATGDEELIEDNTWGDTYWGVSGGKGENHLGKILMKVRSEL